MPSDGLIHQRIIASFVDRGRPPSREELANELDEPAGVVEDALRRLEAEHGVVLQAPPTYESRTRSQHRRLASGSPTATAAGGCHACGARCGSRCSQHRARPFTHGTAARPSPRCSPSLPPQRSRRRRSPLPIPVRKAWDNVVHWCATVQPFRTPGDAAAWSARHGFALGDVVPLNRLLALARVWYGRHLDPSWRKWTVDEARAMFASIGLRSPTWNVSPAAGRF